jgi:hypothetical protein
MTHEGLHAGLIEPGQSFEIDLMPAEKYVKEHSASGRVAALLMFRTYHSNPHLLHIPSVYEDALQHII